MLDHLTRKIQERGDMDKNDEENEACETFRTICKEALQTEYKVFDAGRSGCVESIQTHNKLSRTGKRRTIREAHILLTKMNELFNSRSSRLAIKLVNTFLPYVIQRMGELLEKSSEKMRTENINDVCETNQHELNHEQRAKRKERIEYLKKVKIPQTEWVFHLR